MINSMPEHDIYSIYSGECNILGLLSIGITNNDRRSGLKTVITREKNGFVVFFLRKAKKRFRVGGKN